MLLLSAFLPGFQAQVWRKVPTLLQPQDAKSLTLTYLVHKPYAAECTSPGWLMAVMTALSVMSLGSTPSRRICSCKSGLKDPQTRILRSKRPSYGEFHSMLRGSAFAGRRNKDLRQGGLTSCQTQNLLAKTWFAFSTCQSHNASKEGLTL